MVPKVTPILVNGSMEKLMVMGFILGSMEIDMKENLRNVLNMGKGLRNLLMGIFIRDFIRMGSLRDLANTTGQTEATSKANSKMDSATAKESGNATRAPPTNTKASIKTTKNLATESSPGQPATSTKATTNPISATAMARCTGPMEVIIRANGKMGYKMGKGNCMSLGRKLRKGFFKTMCWLLWRSSHH